MAKGRKRTREEQLAHLQKKLRESHKKLRRTNPRENNASRANSSRANVSEIANEQANVQVQANVEFGESY